MGKRKKIKALRTQVEQLAERLPDKGDLLEDVSEKISGKPKKKRRFLRKVALVGVLTAAVGGAVAFFKSKSDDGLLPPYSPNPGGAPPKPSI